MQKQNGIYLAIRAFNKAIRKGFGGVDTTLQRSAELFITGITKIKDIPSQTKLLKKFRIKKGKRALQFALSQPFNPFPRRGAGGEILSPEMFREPTVSERLEERRNLLREPRQEFLERLKSFELPAAEEIFQPSGVSEETQQFFGKQPIPPFAEQYRKVSETAIGAASNPLFSVGGVNLSAGDLVAAGLVVFAGYQGIQALTPAAKRFIERFPEGLTKGIDKRIAELGRTPELQGRLARFFVGNKTRVIETATNNLKRNIAAAKGKGAETVVQKTVDETIKDIEKLPEFARTQTKQAVRGELVT